VFKGGDFLDTVSALQGSHLFVSRPTMCVSLTFARWRLHAACGPYAIHYNRNHNGCQSAILSRTNPTADHNLTRFHENGLETFGEHFAKYFLQTNK